MQHQSVYLKWEHITARKLLLSRIVLKVKVQECTGGDRTGRAWGTLRVKWGRAGLGSGRRSRPRQQVRGPGYRHVPLQQLIQRHVCWVVFCIPALLCNTKAGTRTFLKDQSLNTRFNNQDFCLFCRDSTVLTSPHNCPNHPHRARWGLPIFSLV